MPRDSLQHPAITLFGLAVYFRLDYVSVQIPDSQIPDYYSVLRPKLLREPWCSFCLCGIHASTNFAVGIVFLGHPRRSTLDAPRLRPPSSVLRPPSQIPS